LEAYNPKVEVNNRDPIRERIVAIRRRPSVEVPRGGRILCRRNAQCRIT
jgi:hypothetical protein